MVAVKTESAQHRSLASEYKAYRILADSKVTPQPRWLGNVGDSSVLVTELLGPSLEDLFNFCDRRFSLKTVLQIADQTLECLEIVHGHGLVHRDVKPDNFMIGLGEKASSVLVADFGLVGAWNDAKTRQHVPKRTGRGLMGTIRYMSVNAHWGLTQSRRDDLESLGYMLLYFLRGSLPWMEVRSSQNTQAALSDAVLRLKTGISVEELCSGLPCEFAEYLRYCRRLRFDEDPDYGYVRQLFQGLLADSGFKDDCVFDWTLVATRAAAAAVAQAPAAKKTVLAAQERAPGLGDEASTAEASAPASDSDGSWRSTQKSIV